MLSYPAAIALSTHTLAQLRSMIAGQRCASGGRWWRITAGQQALLVLAYLRNGDTYARLAAGFGVATSTAWRYVHDTLALLAALVEDIDQVAARAAALAWVLLDGTLVPIDRVGGQRRYYSGRHRRHGVNVQVLADPFGRLPWASPPTPGATHDVTAARAAGVIAALTSRNVETWADKAYGQGLPRRRRDHPDPLQTPPDPPTPVDRTESGEPRSRPDPVPGRASRRRAQRLARARPAPLLPPLREHRHRRDHRPQPDRNPPPTSRITMKKAPGI